MRLSEGDRQRVATVLPGRGYSPDRPLLHYTCRILADRGWTVREHWWSRGDATSDKEAAAEAVAAVKGAGHPRLHLVVGKSLGSLAAPATVDHALPAIWFTPLLRDDLVRAAVSATLEPALALGGTADAHWDGELLRQTRCQVHEVRGADHSLEIPGSVRETLKVLERVMRRVEDFVDGLES